MLLTGYCWPECGRLTLACTHWSTPAPCTLALQATEAPAPAEEQPSPAKPAATTATEPEPSPAAVVKKTSIAKKPAFAAKPKAASASEVRCCMSVGGWLWQLLGGDCPAALPSLIRLPAALSDWVQDKEDEAGPSSAPPPAKPAAAPKKKPLAVRVVPPASNGALIAVACLMGGVLWLRLGAVGGCCG